MSNRVLNFNFHDNQVDVGLDFKGNGSYTTIASNVPEDKIKEFYRQQLLNSTPIIFPPAIRYVSPRGNMVVWERPPTYQSIHYTNQKQDKISIDSPAKYQFRIPIPWQVYIVYFSPQYTIADVWMFFRTEPLANNDLALYYAPINNFYSDGRLCQAVYNEIPVANNLFQLLDNVYTMIWNSGFNNDLHDLVNHHSPIWQYASLPDSVPASHYYEAWSRLSLSDVVEKVSWTKAASNIVGFQNKAKADPAYEIVQFISDIQDIASL